MMVVGLLLLPKRGRQGNEGGLVGGAFVLKISMSNGISNDMNNSRMAPATANELISTLKKWSTASPPTKKMSKSPKA